MENIGKLFELIVSGMKTELVLYGHTFSWWQVFVFIIVSCILIEIIGGIISE